MYAAFKSDRWQTSNPVARCFLLAYYSIIY